MNRKRNFGKELAKFEGFSVKQNLEGQSGVSICLGKKYYAGPFKNKDEAMDQIKNCLTKRVVIDQHHTVRMITEGPCKSHYGTFKDGKLITGSDKANIEQAVTVANGIKEQKYFYRHIWNKK